MVGCEMYIEKEERRWVETLLNSEFFGGCGTHRELRKNERNVFCLDCNAGFCRHCLKSHSCFHRHLQICKYVYQDVVRLLDIQKHFDCSRIQTYKINGEKAVHLNPRPVQKDAKPSTKAKFGAACVVCRRYLQDLPNRYCSIACKVSAAGSSCILEAKTEPSLLEDGVPITPYKETSNNENEEGSALTETIWEADGDEEETGEEEERGTEWLTVSPCSTAKSFRKPSHQRKGIPRRAPFF
ncbi:unnamed protein product [Linum tenue]|uniref:B box-type domain-containing protein n=1 Tax=Linum tenue TaxID=586396 RepID=A0AAV0NFM3_9ROSI|nr:unnamed protein product [Linum tenue]